MIKKTKGFTLIELIAVLVIMAIIALIVTPLVMNIIRKARIAADKRSIDAYGRSIELAIAGYLLDNGKFPTDINQLSIEYSGDTVLCEITQINPDSSVYLAECTVKNRNVEGYSYGKNKQPKTYSIGEQVTYNGVDYYVIKNSGPNEQAVTLLKAEPLTVAEVNTYGTGHVNRNTDGSRGTAYNQNGYGGMAYYSSPYCDDLEEKYSGCITSYASSDIKYVVDAWKNVQAPTAIEARLILSDEVINLGYELGTVGVSDEGWIKTESTPNFIYSSSYSYWTMSSYNDSLGIVWYVTNGDYFGNTVVADKKGVVRPVIVLSKSVLSSE